MQNSIDFIYSSNIQLEDVMEGKTLFTTLSRKKKYLEIKVTRNMQNL